MAILHCLNHSSKSLRFAVHGYDGSVVCVECQLDVMRGWGHVVDIQSEEDSGDQATPAQGHTVVSQKTSVFSNATWRTTNLRTLPVPFITSVQHAEGTHTLTARLSHKPFTALFRVQLNTNSLAVLLSTRRSRPISQGREFDGYPINPRWVQSRGQ